MVTGPDAAFAAERPRLVGLAYRMLGSVADAEDVVQDVWLRWDAADRAAIERPAAWLTTVTTRRAIDRLRAQRRRREDYVGPWLPEPLPTATGVTDPAPLRSDDPEAVLDAADSLGTGLLVVLDTLGDVERAVFVLADVFAVPFDEIAEAVDRSPEACRQVASRARRKVRDARADLVAADEGLLAELVGAVAVGDVDAVLRLLAPDVVLVSDGGPDRRAGRRPVVGAERVARYLVNLGARTPPDATVGFEELNGAPALVVRSPSLGLVMTAEREMTAGRIGTVRMVLNPDKLHALDRHPSDTNWA